MEYKIRINCNACNKSLTLRSKESALGASVNVKCPSCGNQLKNIKLPTKEEYEARLQRQQRIDSTSTDSTPTELPTRIEGPMNASKSYYIEALENNVTPYQSFEIDQSHLTFGRSPNSVGSIKADLLLKSEDKFISRIHCVFRKHDNGVTVEDKSKNGTFLKGNRLQEREEIYLNNGDMLKMGDTFFKVIIK